MHCRVTDSGVEWTFIQDEPWHPPTIELLQAMPRCLRVTMGYMFAHDSPAVEPLLAHACAARHEHG